MNSNRGPRRLPLIVVSLLAFAAAVLLPGRIEPAGADPACASVPAAGQSVARRPTVFVHGWTDNGAALTGAAAELVTRTRNAIAPFFFDYGAHSTTWAADDQVQGCLARFIQGVSDGYRRAGGDGKVLVVGHSMGGLAALYASAGQGIAADIGGVVTFDTPYLGSPFGGTSLGAHWQGAQEALKSIRAAPIGSSAQQCLAPHEDGSPIPSPCSSALPPYLPTAVPLTAIGGQITVRRTFAGIHLYDLSLDSDGVVPTESSHGYVEMQKKAQWPMGEPVSIPTTGCTINSDTLKIAAQTAGWTKSALDGLLVGIGQVAADNNALDGLLTGKLTPGLLLYLGAATLSAPCSHINIYRDASALDTAAAALNSDLSALAAHDRLAYRDLLSAPVPPLCQFKAGTLVNGTLVGHTESAGEPPTLAGPSKVSYGDLDGDGVGDAAAVVQCNAGGVSWPDNIVFWRRGATGRPTLLGAYQMGDAVGDARGATQKLTYLAGGSVQVDTLDSRKFDAACCPSGRAQVILKWDGHRVSATRIQHLSGPNDVTFTGIGPIRLGMSTADLGNLGYTSMSPESDGCVQYSSAAGLLYVLIDPKTDSVVKITPDPDRDQFRTVEGLGTGIFLDQVRQTYANDTIEDHEDHSFGQGSSGLLVGNGSGGWISFFDDGAGLVSGIEVSDHQHYGALEAGC